jgi:hypothetical protein
MSDPRVSHRAPAQPGAIYTRDRLQLPTPDPASYVHFAEMPSLGRRTTVFNIVKWLMTFTKSLMANTKRLIG